MSHVDYASFSREQLIERLQKLEQENELLRFVINAAPMQISYVDQQQRYRLINTGYEDWFGLHNEDILGRPVSEILGPQTYANIRSRIEQALAGEYTRYQYRLKKHNLGDHDLAVTYIPHRKADEIAGFCVVVQDITAMEQARIALAESERKFRSLFEQAPVGINLVAMDGKPFLVNQATQRLLGYSSEELCSTPYTHWTHPDDIATGQQLVQQLHGENIDHVALEKRYVHKNGDIIWAHTTVSAVRNGHGDIEYRIAIIQDISQRKQTEQILTESRERLELTESIAHLGSWELDLENNQLIWSDETYRIFGLQPRQFAASYEAFLNCVHPDDRDLVNQAYIDSLHDNRDHYEIEHRVIRQDNGDIRYVQEKCRHFRNLEGRTIRSVGMVRDITETKQAEHDLLLRTRELEALIDTIPAMVYVKDRQLRNVMINQSFCQETCLPPEQILGRGDAGILPDDLAMLCAQSDQLVLSTGQPIRSVEQSWLEKNGHRRWVSTSKTPYFDTSGEVSGLAGVSVDITINKEAEAERLIAVERQRDTLIREVHHRIKNHLQGVLGLIRNAMTANPVIAEQLELAIRPVHTIAQVYGLLSTRSDANVRVCDLTRTIAESTTGKVPVHVELPCNEEAILAQSEAIPVALVINELITNALKHLQRADPQQPVVATLTLQDGLACLEIRSGPATLPAGFDFARGTGIGTGLELVTTLLPRSGATLAIEQQGDEVVATLTLMAPLVTLITN